MVCRRACNFYRCAQDTSCREGREPVRRQSFPGTPSQGPLSLSCAWRKSETGDPYDPVIAGVHYPSDVAAGQKLGAEIARKLLANADFQTALERTKEECFAHVAH
jgi:hypothetical protein